MAMFLNLQRVIKSGFIAFWRNGTVSLASLLVFTVTLFVIGGLLLGSAVFDAALTQIKGKVDVTVYIQPDTFETDILSLKQSIEQLPEVKEVVYKSSEEVLAEFRITHANDSLILQSLDELGGENPLRAELNIAAQDPRELGSIVTFLENESIISRNNGAGIIEKISSQNEKNQEAIDRFIDFTNTVETLGLYIAIFTALITVLVTFNTIRLAIYTSKDEISVMKLVGASDNYVRGPFIVEGIMYGVFSAFFTLALLYPVTRWISPLTKDFFGSINLFEYYISNFPMIFLILVGVGAVLGIVSSLLAIRRYLKV
ncbi:hypothetical protein CL654_03410 [bacterium]|nr:hypothetical protein [bacterium]|tara:strand:- start:283 stop:1224 length:942 start_codon:yes stop_codon:yes gene_type:complete